MTLNLNDRTKIYICARYSRREEMEEVADELSEIGYAVVSRWVYGGEEGLNDEAIAVLDLQDIDLADIVLSFTEPLDTLHTGGGRHVEFGYAYNRVTSHDYDVYPRIVIVGERENVFHHLPGVEQYDTLEDFITEEYKEYVEYIEPE